MTPLAINIPNGIGDLVYQYPIIREVSKTHELWIRTYWPQLFWCLPNIHFVPPYRVSTWLTAQNVDEFDQWEDLPDGIREIRYSYCSKGWDQGKSIRQQLFEASGINTPDISFPVHPRWLSAAIPFIPDASFAIIKASSIRSEFPAVSRNPDQQYIQRAIDILRERGIFTIVTGYCGPGEKLVEPQLNRADAIYYSKFHTTTMIALWSKASLIVGGPGVNIPLSQALGVPSFTIFGGLVPPHLLDCKDFAAPEPFCKCDNIHHTDCNKVIKDFDKQFENYLDKLFGTNLVR